MLSLQEAFITCIKKSFTYQGRASRAEFWWWILCVIILASTLAFLLIDNPNIIFFLLLCLGLLVLPTLAVTIRRLHDVEKSGAWMWLILTPFASFPLLFFYAVNRGTKGPNRFGADPLYIPPTLPKHTTQYLSTPVHHTYNQQRKLKR